MPPSPRDTPPHRPCAPWRRSSAKPCQPAWATTISACRIRKTRPPKACRQAQFSASRCSSSSSSLPRNTRVGACHSVCFSQLLSPFLEPSRVSRCEACRTTSTRRSASSCSLASPRRMPFSSWNLPRTNTKKGSLSSKPRSPVQDCACVPS